MTRSIVGPGRFAWCSELVALNGWISTTNGDIERVAGARCVYALFDERWTEETRVRGMAGEGATVEERWRRERGGYEYRGRHWWWGRV